MQVSIQVLIFLLSCLASQISDSPAYCESDSKPREPSYVFVKTVHPEGNIILEDAMLAESLDMGSGIYLAPALLDLIAEEMEGFYSSNGFHHVKAYISQPKSIKGTLALKIDEQPEIKAGQTDNLRAKIAIDRLITRHSLKADNETKENALKGLVKRYRLKRVADAKAERLRIRSEITRAKAQRNRYLKILAKKRKAEEEMRLIQRENLMNILTRQKEFFFEIKKTRAEHLEQMRHRKQTIVDARFNHGPENQDKFPAAPGP